MLQCRSPKSDSVHSDDCHSSGMLRQQYETFAVVSACAHGFLLCTISMELPAGQTRLFQTAAASSVNFFMHLRGNPFKESSMNSLAIFLACNFFSVRSAI